MSRLTLCEQIDRTEFGDESAELFTFLTGFNLPDDRAAVVLVAAAQMLARQHTGTGLRASEALFSLCEEFTDLVFEARARLCQGRCRPALRIVGGSDVHP